MTDAVVFDIDSTLADSSKRAARMINRENRHLTDWLAYAMASGEDAATSTAQLAKLFHRLGVTVGLCTFRPESSRDVTQKWLAAKGIEYEFLVMSKDDTEMRPVEYKVAALERISESFKVLMHFDDSWEICQAVENLLGIPAVCVRSYAPAQDLLAF